MLFISIQILFLFSGQEVFIKSLCYLCDSKQLESGKIIYKTSFFLPLFKLNLLVVTGHTFYI